MFDDTLLAFDAGGAAAHRARPAAGGTRRILVVLHQEHSTPGRVGRLLVEQGFRLDIRRPRFGDPLPRTMDAHDGAIVFGGPMSANDAASWIADEIDWIGVPLAAGKPFLGICLGAQMLARHLGQRVAPHPQGRVEAGYYPIRATAEGDGLCARALPAQVYQWHGEGVDLPRGATLLAGGDDFAVQAFAYGGSAYGLQFHPEVTYAMMCRWTVADRDHLAMPGALPRDQHLRGWFLHDAPVARWLEDFLRQWVRGRRAGPDPRPVPRGGEPALA